MKQVMQHAMQYALPATERDYAPSNVHTPDVLRRVYYRWTSNRQLLAPVLGFTMYLVLVLMMSAEVLFGQV